VLPWASVAEQLTTLSPIGNRDPAAGVQMTGTLPSTRSNASAGYHTSAPDEVVASATMSSGSSSRGGVVSTTAIWSLPRAALPAASCASHTTVVTPSGATDPALKLHLGSSAPLTASSAETSSVAVAPVGPVASRTKPAGRVRTGGVVSTILTVKVPVETFPSRSRASHCTSVSPSGYITPDAGSQVTGTDPSTASVAVAA
jgi:hypothetical protein